MKKLFCIILCLMVLPLCAWADEDGYLAFVNGKTADRVHLRKAPSTDSESLGLFFTGTPVTCFSAPNQTWTKVKIGAQSGYMMSKFLSTADEAGFEMVGRVKNVPDYVRVLTEPKDGADFVFSISSGETTRVLGETNSHWYCICEGADVGYIRTKYLSVESVDRKVSVAGTPTVSLDSPYMPVLQTYYRAMAERWDLEKLFDRNMSEMCDFHIRQGNPFDTVGYMLKDMNNDGTPELLIGSLMEGYTDKTLFEMYVLNDGKPVSVARSWARSNFYLCEDKAIGHEGSNSAGSGLSALMYLNQENALDYIEVTMIEYDYSPNAPYWVSDTYNYGQPSGRALTEKEYMENLARYASLRIQY
ncbi:MAG: SH3 domain-containing protein, partial [Clostridia bacterium]|nr:SH3 domain-containing protein [Clostridia bacterium]